MNVAVRTVATVAIPTNLGMPRIGPRRELKRAIESYWAGRTTRVDVDTVASTLRAANWQLQASAGIAPGAVPSNDFSFYDRMLDTCCLVGAIPPRFDYEPGGGGVVDLDTTFAMARGHAGDQPVHPMEMTKWFDTNYHYLVPELEPDTAFHLASNKPFDELAEAHGHGHCTRPALIGPVTFLLLAKSPTSGLGPAELLRTLIHRLLPVYEEVLVRLAAGGAEWVQLEEPCLVTDLDTAAQEALIATYQRLAGASSCKLLLTTYFGGLGDNVALLPRLGIGGVHVDLVRDPDQLTTVQSHLPEGAVLSAGVVDGRNVWRTDLRKAIEGLAPLAADRGDHLWVAPSCSLLHVPYDLDAETTLDPELRAWLAFGRQKLDEVVTIARALDEGLDAVGDMLEASDRAARSMASSPRIRSDEVRRRTAHVVPDDARRRSPYEVRRTAQRRRLSLPLLPTTTIGSFPQTAEIRRARQRHDGGELSDLDYRDFCRREIEHVVREQEALGLDVLVHGEPERNDMVQYFGERLDGFATTEAGWVQSYGTRCVRPPILYGDVKRPGPITIDWLKYAQSLTAAPIKGMLTGPVTILQWSFVRTDQPRDDTCRQIALAIRDEVTDLEAVGIGIIQVDEPALREGLPLRHSARGEYLDWATECFRLATSGVVDETQIHTHMCYAEFRDILDAVVALDADVISMEAARSGMDMLAVIAATGYRAEIGPGVYDIHSPHAPSEAEILALMDQTLRVVPATQLWVNPDCGLKTRTWEEIKPALAHMVSAARQARASVAPAS